MASVKVRSIKENDAKMIKIYSHLFQPAANKLINEQFKVILERNYFIEEVEERNYKIFCQNKNDGSYNLVCHDETDLLKCSCQFYCQQNLPSYYVSNG